MSRNQIKETKTKKSQTKTETKLGKKSKQMILLLLKK